MIGGGQLARMTHEAGIPLGIRFKLLSDTPIDSAALVAGEVVVGDYRDLETLRAFAAGCDVITFDHEHVPSEHPTPWCTPRTRASCARGSTRSGCRAPGTGS
jgi:5-(carboxyamino)imidazole ribonucleotide synthase